MKPILLHGHERSITQIRYSREGDLIFSCAKDSTPNVWFSLNGERLGSYRGHNGAVWCLDVDWCTQKLLTGSADNSCRLWDCEKGVALITIPTSTAVRTNGFSYSGQLIMFSTDTTMGQQCTIHIYDSRDDSQITNCKPARSVEVTDSKVTCGLWGPYDEYLITGHENGELRHYDIKTGDQVLTVADHKRSINDIQASLDQTMIITASKDNTAKLFDSSSLQLMKTFRTERPVNSASMSSLKEHVILGGGQEAMEVTTTSARVGKFDARFFHLIFEEEFGRVKGHFGPINSVAFHPDGKSFSSGGEDGYVRVHYFDQSYFDFEMEI
ncbi:eukaryotic translation initiation factor 3 subunit I [Octopus vulgaris]|uniref:Eukaryotic translation initiation factor 3 subunit I n=2 Tax=Octopus TaxID=6643 RepID=A0AA36FJK7_OCTVU|nr:eukaryotic translation initiation factor 3 subunit I [Octopus sinensis]CAI9739369.1 eukaryotic translation initiation factor 3 subunit I [Octopus vulgaris]